MAKILLNKYKSKTSVNKDENIPVQLETSRNQLPNDDIQYDLDTYQQYLKEASASTKFRIIASIKPYCSNILHNILTEVVKNEGSTSITLLGTSGYGLTAPTEAQNSSKLTRIQAIRDTEYSKDSIGFVYHCGDDIFNNHLLRSNTFKSVNKVTAATETFNTISDYARYADGTQVIYRGRIASTAGNFTSFSSETKMHLYQVGDIDDFATARYNLMQEEDGWEGFSNGSKIKTYATAPNLVMNSNKSCETIEMYPDQSLYSFVPKINKFKDNRAEYNWKWTLTYPYKSVIDIPNQSLLTADGALICNDAYASVSYGTSKKFVLSTNTKHNLAISSTIKLFYRTADTSSWNEIKNIFSVDGLGDINGEETGTTFYIAYDEISQLFTSDSFLGYQYAFKRVVNGIDCKYYYRIFRQIPNYKFSPQAVTDENINDLIETNALKIPFSATLSKIGFAQSVYGDNQAQLVFTDDVDVAHLTDNLGRPLSEIYLTIVKNNKGWKKWYYDTPITATTISDNEDEIEFSHCFGKITSGFKLNGYAYNSKAEYNNVMYMHNIGVVDNNIATPSDNPFIRTPLSLESGITAELGITIDGGYTAGMFVGDLVEFSPAEYMETQIEPIYHRFNTAQREINVSGNSRYSDLIYDTLVSDDYEAMYQTGPNAEVSVAGFNVTESAYNGSKYGTTAFTRDYSANLQPEGYIYKPHYKMQIRAISDTLNQNYREALQLSSAPQFKENNTNGYSTWYLRTKYNYAIEKSTSGQTRYIYAVKNNGATDLVTEKCKIDDVRNGIRIKIEPIVANSIITIEKAFRTLDDLNNYTGKTNGKTYYVSASQQFYHWSGATADDVYNVEFRKDNTAIPSYAYDLSNGSGALVWRNVTNLSDYLLTTSSTTFTNGAFYLYNDVNLYLQRQDPFNDTEFYLNELGMSGSIKNGGGKGDITFVNNGQSKSIDDYTAITEKTTVRKC